jgi:hypothetical protein
MSTASGLLGSISEQPHDSIRTAANEALFIIFIVTPIPAHPGWPRAVFVTRVTTEAPRPWQGAQEVQQVLLIGGAQRLESSRVRRFC